MHSVHYIRSSALVQIVQLANHVLVQEIALVVRGIIKVRMKKYLSTHKNRLWSGPGTETYILDYLLSKQWMRELIQTTPCFLMFTPK